MEKKFQTLNAFQEKLSSVYSFFYECFNTIIAKLQEKGDIELTEDEQEDFKFTFLDVDGIYTVKAIRLVSETSFYLDTVDYDGNKYQADWTDINHDLIITEMLMERIFQ